MGYRLTGLGMASILCIPLVFILCTLYLYYLSTHLPELPAASQNVQLSFPKNLTELKNLSDYLLEYKTHHPGYVLLLFVSAYLYKQTFAIPGSVFLNLMAGAVFSLPYGFPLVCLLTACGATCCYLLSKAFGKAFIVRFFPEKVKSLQNKVEENSDGLIYFLLFLRLFPASPNWFLNMASPIINIPVHLFFLSVFIGLMPYNFTCVQAGSMLSQITSTSDIFTFSTMIKLGLIAVVALLPGYITNRWRQKGIKIAQD